MASIVLENCCFGWVVDEFADPDEEAVLCRGSSYSKILLLKKHRFKILCWHRIHFTYCIWIANKMLTYIKLKHIEITVCLWKTLLYQRPNSPSDCFCYHYPRFALYSPDMDSRRSLIQRWPLSIIFCPRKFGRNHHSNLALFNEHSQQR